MNWPSFHTFSVSFDKVDQGGTRIPLSVKGVGGVGQARVFSHFSDSFDSRTVKSVKFPLFSVLSKSAISCR